MFESLKQWRIERGLQNTIGNIEANICEELTELLRATTVDDRIDALCDIIVFSVNAIEAYGYDAEVAMSEVCKEIHSRKGDFNPELNKWQKFRTPEAMALWYTADFNKAKR
jgi:NTP pyrophosphatase (non-canonical NTP hydrolase)